MSMQRASSCHSACHNHQHLDFGACSWPQLSKLKTYSLRANLLTSGGNALATKLLSLPRTRKHSIARNTWRQSSWLRSKTGAERSCRKTFQTCCQCGSRRKAISCFTPPPIAPLRHCRKVSDWVPLQRSKLRALPEERAQPSADSADTSEHVIDRSALDRSIPPPSTSTSTAPLESASSTDPPNKASFSDRDASGFHTTASGSPDSSQVPNLTAGVNWYCLSMIGLVTLIDFSPMGPILRSTSGSAVPWILEAVQWGLFVAPTVNSCRSEGYDLRRTFGIQKCSLSDVAASAAIGASLWAVVTAAIAARVAADGGQQPSSESVAIADLLFSRPTSPAEWASLLTSAGVSPGVAEELLFRGFLLTALRQGLGRVDAVVLCAALFGLFHLSVPQFFPTTVLGIAAGVSALASGSIAGPIAVHTAHNIAALLYGGVAPGDVSGLPASIIAGSAFTLAFSGAFLLVRAKTAARID